MISDLSKTMNKKLRLLLTVISVALFLMVLTPTLASLPENSWVSKAPMPTARGFLGVAVVNEKIYAIGGSGPIGINEEYDYAKDTWTTKALMPNPQQSFSIAICRGKVYCIGGISSNSIGFNKVYDPSTDSWETKSPMPTSRYGALAQVVGDKIYVIGGVRLLGYNEGFEQLNVTEVYDPSSDTWITKASMPNPAGYVSAVIDDRIFVIGSEETQIYDPKTNTWSTGASPQVSISRGANGVSAAAAATSGLMAPKLIYVYDGSSLQIYNPQNDSWTFGASPPTSRQYLGIAVVNDLLYFIGGFMQTHITRYIDYETNEQYTPIGYGTLSEKEPSQPSFPMLPIALAISMGIIVIATVSILLERLWRKLK